LIAYPMASNVSKNRFGITEPLPFDLNGGNPLAPYLAQNKG